MFARLVVLALAMGAALAEQSVRMEPEVTVFSAPSWMRGARVTSADEIKLQFFLKHSTEQRESLDETLMDRATPSSANYGKWLSGEELTELVAAPRSTIDAVVEFILSASTDAALDVHVGRHQDMLSVKMAADSVEALLSTELYHFGHRTYSNMDVIRAGTPYHLPESLASKVSLVGELIRLPAFRTMELILEPEAEANTTTDSAWGSCGSKYSTMVNPAVLQERYGYPSLAKKDVAPGNNFAVAEFQGQNYDTTDLENFGSACGLDVAPTVSKTIGGNTPGRCNFGPESCIESLLDIEYAGSVAANIPMTVYYSDTFSLLDWAQTVNDNVDAEHVHSVSYGNDELQQTSTEYMYSANTEFAKLGVKGITIAIASGDQGVWGRTGSSTGKFNPDFPASSPYVTAVGGTDFKVKGLVGDESAWADGGGGFSDTFGIPWWQATEVAAFVDQTDIDESYFNSSGRGYPDVSALAGTNNAYFVAYHGSRYTGVGGTSAACPVFAGIVAQLNNVRLAAGGAPLGFMNPWIYANGKEFNDVTSGTNDANTPKRDSKGFTAIKGWDAATGFGTPNFAKLAAKL